MIPACTGQSDLFDSTDAADHLIARELCATCPMLDRCRELLEEAREAAATWRDSGPAGTWAGELITGPRNLARLADEDGRWSDDAARRAHNRWNAGARDVETSEGERVYQRRRAARRRAQQKGSAA